MKKVIIIFGILIFLVVMIMPISGFLVNKAFANPQGNWAKGMVVRGARLRMFLGRHKAAVAILHKTLEVFPEHRDKAKIHFWLGVCYEKEGNIPKAREWFTSFVEGWPRHMWNDLAKRRIATLEAKEL